MSLRSWKSHTSRLSLIDRKISRFNQILHQEKYKILSNSLGRIAEYAHIKKEYALYIVNLATVLKEVRQSKLKLAFFHIKQNSQAVYLKQIEKKNSLRRVLNHRIMRDYVELKNFVWKWKIASLTINKKKTKDVLLGKEKTYLGRCLFNLLKRGLQNEKESAFACLRDFVDNTRKMDDFSGLLNDITLRNLEYGFNSLKENSESVAHNQEIKKSLQKVVDLITRKTARNSMSFLLQIKKLQTTAKKIERHEKAAKLESVITNITKNNLHKGLRMIEFAFISKKNRENFYINLALKTGLLLKNIHNELKSEFFDNLKMHYEHEVQFRRFLTNVVARKHIKSLSYFFNKFKTRLIVIKASRSTLRLVEKNIALAVDKLVKFQRDQATHFFSNLRLCKPKQQIEQVTAFRKPAVVSIQFPTFTAMPRRLSKFELTKKIFGMISVLKKICLKQEALGFRLILAQVSHQDPRDFTPPSERQLTPISQRQISFSIDNTFDKSLKAELERGSTEIFGSLDSFDDYPRAQHVLQNEEKITKRRMKKYFTDWRLTYIKTTNKKNKLICGFNKIWNMFKRDRIQSLWWSFNILKQSFTDKPQKLSLVYVPYSAGVKFSTGRKTTGHSRVASHSPISYATNQSQNALRLNRSPTSDNKANTYSISPAPVSGRRTNPSKSPAPENRSRHSNRSPAGKANSFSQRPTARTGNDTPDKLLNMPPVYSIVGKKEF